MDSQVAMFDGTTGVLLKDSGLTLSGSNTGDQIISDATLSTTDITDQDFTTSKHGFVPKGTNVGKYLKDDGTWDAVFGGLYEAVCNGTMNLWQRGTSFVSAATATMLADQYEVEYVTGGSVDVSRVVPTIELVAGQKLNYALRLDVNTIDASIAVGDFVSLSQKIEGIRSIPWVHQEFTVSFFTRSSTVGQYGFAVGNSGDDRNYTTSFTVDVLDTWERKSITVPVQDETGTWDYLAGIGLNLRWTLMSGTDHDGTDVTWNSTADFTIAGTTNLMLLAANYFELTGVQIDLGPNALPFRGQDEAQDFQVASRYFQKSYDHGVDPAAISALGQVVFRAHGVNHLQHVQLPVKMPAIPVIVLYNPTDGLTGEWEDVGAAAAVATTTANIGMQGFEANITTSVDLNEVNGHWTAENKL